MTGPWHPARAGPPEHPNLGARAHGEKADHHPVPQVAQLRVFVSVLDVNDNPPVFPFEVKVEKVLEVSVRGARLVTLGWHWGTSVRGEQHRGLVGALTTGQVHGQTSAPPSPRTLR